MHETTRSHELYLSIPASRGRRAAPSTWCPSSRTPRASAAREAAPCEGLPARGLSPKRCVSPGPDWQPCCSFAVFALQPALPHATAPSSSVSCHACGPPSAPALSLPCPRASLPQRHARCAWARRCHSGVTRASGTRQSARCRTRWPRAAWATVRAWLLCDARTGPFFRSLGSGLH